jgi:O-antigen/teichoic acid export membrane protein
VSFFSQKIDEAIIVALLGITQLGYYSVAKKLCVTLADMLYSSIRKVLIPVFSKMQDNIGKVAESAIRVATYAGAFTFPLFLATASANKELIIFLFGEKWESISVPFSILMVSGIFMLTPAILHPFFNAIGKPGIPLKLNISRVVISALSISVGSMFGLFGVAVGVFVRALIGAVLDVSFFRREVMGDVAAFLNGQVSNLLLCLPMITAILVLNLLINGGMSHGMTLLLYCIIGGVTYISTLAVFRVGLLTDLLLKVKKIF